MYCGHDFTPFLCDPDKAAVRRELGLSPDAFVIGHVGRFDSVKNHDFLLQIAFELTRKRAGVKLLLIGEGDLRESIRKLATSLRLGDAVVFAGSRADVPRLLMGAMNVFVFPSFHEALSLACVEAQAAGLPLVVSDTLPPELDVVPGAVTRLSLSAAPNIWADTCIAAESKPRLPKRESLAILQHSAFTIETCITHLDSVYAGTSDGLWQSNHQPLTSVNPAAIAASTIDD
jgi:glycosyltransferase involved in cell wall biosynthesis